MIHGLIIQSQENIFSRPVLRPTYLPVHWANRTISTGLKWTRHEADPSLLFSDEDDNDLNYTSMS